MITKINSNTAIHLIVLLASAVSVNAAFANPQGGVVTSGSATITQAPNSTVIQQSSDKAIIQWNSFNINAGEKTQFVQPSASSVALNRINPNQGASQIYGQLSSNGQVILVNAAGIHFGSSAVVNVGGMIASTSDILDANFLAGNYSFNQASSYRNASIVNQGKIIAANYGLVALLGSNVTNSGLVQAEMGNVILGSGNTFTLSFAGDQLINFAVNSAATNANITNSGSLVADGGKVMVSAQAAQSVLDNVINMGGIVQANNVSQQNGEIILASNAGVNVSGKLSAKSSKGSGVAGGTIQISANQLVTNYGSDIDASGDLSGGNINFAANSIAVGGGVKAFGFGSFASGGNVQFTSNAIYLLSGSNVDASGLAGGGTVGFTAATNVSNSFVSMNNSTVRADAIDSGSAGTINVNSATSSFSNSLVSAAGIGAGSFGGSIFITSNNTNIYNGSLLNASGDFLGGNVSISGANQTNAANIYLDSFSDIAANATGSDSVIAGNVNLYANNNYIYGAITATDNMPNGIGGNVGVFGQNIYIESGALIDTSAKFLGGTVALGGNPYSTTANTTSAYVGIGINSLVSAAATGANGFGDSINVSANTVAIAGTLDVSGNPYPYVTYASNNVGYLGGTNGLGGMCGGGNNGGGKTATINNSGSSGGVINIAGNSITVLSTADLTAAGNVFGGQIILGSDPTQGPAVTATIAVNAGSVMDAGSYGTTANGVGGIIQMFANNTTMNGSLNVSGAANTNSIGGQVEIFAQKSLSVGSTANIVANGGGTGGEVLLGGDLNGAGFDPNSQSTTVAQGSYISASALTNGTGGEVVVWSGNSTTFAGTIVATGGVSGGNGGNVEIGSGGTLKVTKSAYINVKAPKGMAGTITLVQQ